MYPLEDKEYNFIINKTIKHVEFIEPKKKDMYKRVVT